MCMWSLGGGDEGYSTERHQWEDQKDRVVHVVGTQLVEGDGQ